MSHRQRASGRTGRRMVSGFTSALTAVVGSFWKMPSTGGQAIQITRNSSDTPQESPDGKFVYVIKGWP